MTDILMLKGIYSQGYGIIPKMVMRSSLPRDAKCIYAYICSYAGSGTTAFPSVETIRQDLKISKDAFYKNLEVLKDEGYISVTGCYETGTGKFQHNVYELNIELKPISQQEREEKERIRQEKAAKKVEKERARKAKKEPCPVVQDTVKSGENVPCPVVQDTVKEPCPVVQDTVENSQNEPKTLPNSSSPCPVVQDTNNNILKDLNNNNSSTTIKAFKNTLTSKESQEKFSEMKKVYFECFNRHITPMLLEQVVSYSQKGICEKVICYALLETSQAPQPSFKYLKSILDRCVSNSILSENAWLEDKKKYRYKGMGQATPTKRSSFCNMHTHDWDLEELERQASDYMVMQLEEDRRAREAQEGMVLAPCL